MHKKFQAAQWATVCALLISGCGGGGGGGFNAASISPPTGETAPAAAAEGPPPGLGEPAAAPAAGKLTINGAGASPDANGVYQLGIGDRIEVDAPKATSLGTEVSSGGEVSAYLTGKSGEAISLDLSHYSARLWNERNVEADYVMTFKDASGAVLSSYKFHLAAGDSRNGRYLAFTAAGDNDEMSVNFDRQDYRLKQGLAGDLKEDPNDAGTFLLGSPAAAAGSTAVNVARMRFDKDALVGGLPKASTSSRVGGQPFVAVRSTQVAASDLPTTLMGVLSYISASKSPFFNQTIAQMYLFENQGKLLTTCQLSFGSAACIDPVSYNLKATASPGFFEGTNVNNPKEHLTFQAAIVGGEVVLLNAVSQPSYGILEIGLVLRQPWEGGVAHASSTLGRAGSLTAHLDSMTFDLIGVDGTHDLLSVPFGAPPDGVALVRQKVLDSGPFWGMQSQVLSVLAKSRAQDDGSNFLQIGLRR